MKWGITLYSSVLKLVSTPIIQFMIRHILLAFFLVFVGSPILFGQSDANVEPSFGANTEPTSPYQQGFRNGLSFNILLNDFGPGVGVQYEHTLSQSRSFIAQMHLTTIRDVREQTFQSAFGGQFIPNKFRRVLSMPIIMGFKQRILIRALSDQFRLNLFAMAGPNIAFIYPYFKDVNGSQELDLIQRQDGTQELEPVNDIFQGWEDGEFEIGSTGELGLNIDFGSRMKNISSLYFGVYMHYFPQGIQLLEPRVKSAEEFFVTPVIRLTFGKFWGKGNREGRK